jgi:hypothetical protein
LEDEKWILYQFGRLLKNEVYQKGGYKSCVKNAELKAHYVLAEYGCSEECEKACGCKEEIRK